MSRQPTPPRFAPWLLERLLGGPAVEHVLGDLAEEYALQTESRSAAAANAWYFSQVVRSLPILLGGAVWKAGVIATVAVAVVAFLVQSAAEAWLYGLTVAVVPMDTARYVIGAIVGLATMAAAGYVASRVRQPAALVLGVIILGVVVSMMLEEEHSSPLWFRLAFLFGGPLSAIAGGMMASRRPAPPLR